jgi:hypothetical protein
LPTGIFQNAEAGRGVAGTGARSGRDGKFPLGLPAVGGQTGGALRTLDRKRKIPLVGDGSAAGYRDLPALVVMGREPPTQLSEPSAAVTALRLRLLNARQNKVRKRALHRAA